jgi:hypothetical protein
MGVPFENAVSVWLHNTFASADQVQSAVDRIMTGPVNVQGELVDAKQLVQGTFGVAWDLTTPGMLYTLWHVLHSGDTAGFNSTYPPANGDLITGGYSMATVLVIPNVYRCSIQMISGTRQIVNVVGLHGSSSGQQVAAAAALKAAWEVSTGPLPKLSSLVQMTGYQVMDLSTTTGGIATLASAALGGVSTTNALSTRAASALVKWNGASRSLSTRGRLYFGPIMESDINSDGATLTAATQTALGNAFTTFRTQLSSAGFTLCVISRKLAAATDVTNSSVESVIATQRRRIRS